MMNQKEMLKQLVSFNKTTLDIAFRNFFQFQETTEQMTIELCEKASYFPESGRQMLVSLAAGHKHIHNNFITMMDTNCKKIEDYLAN